MADSNRPCKNVRPITFDIDRPINRCCKRMLMSIEIDRVIELYKNMNMLSGPVATVGDIELRLMMEEEINNIKLKYGPLISPTNNGQEMPSESKDENPQRVVCSKKMRKCRRRLLF